MDQAADQEMQGVSYWNQRADLPLNFPPAPSSLDPEDPVSLEMLLSYDLDMFITLSRIIRGFSRGRHLRILDIGTGTGDLGIKLATQGHQVLGVDYSPKMRATAEDYARVAKVSHRYTVSPGVATRLIAPTDSANPQNYPVLEEYFDIVVVSRAFIHILGEKLWIKAVDQARRALARGGLLIIIEPMLEENQQYRQLPQGLKPHGRTRIRSLEDYQIILQGSTYCIGGERYEYTLVEPVQRTHYFEEMYTFACFELKPCT